MTDETTDEPAAQRFSTADETEREAGIANAALAVQRGRLVVLPTDTVYGIGADAFSPAAVADLLAAKGRGRQMPPPVLVPAVATVAGLCADVPDDARALMAAFWPGALTVICRAQPSLAWDLGDTAETASLTCTPACRPAPEIGDATFDTVNQQATTHASAAGAGASNH